jgi:Flp pilus assembly protein TadD
VSVIGKNLKLLTINQRRAFSAIFVLACFMVVNTLYLVFAAHVVGIGRDPEVLPVTYQVTLVSHIVFGILVFGVAIFFIFYHARRMWRINTLKNRATGISLSVSTVLLFVSGFFILSEANSRENYWVFVVHQTTAVMLLIAYLWHRLVSRDPPTLPSVMRTATTLVAMIFSVWIVHVLEVGKDGTVAVAAPVPKDNVRYPDAEILGNNPFVPFSPVGDPVPTSPFFPSKTTTSTGGYLPTRILTHDDLPNLSDFVAETREKGFATNSYLGAQSCERCHADIVKQWSTSAHHFASFNNPFYRKSVEFTRDTVGKKKSQFCGGCHDPAIMLSGNMTKEVDPLVPESQAGLVCLACHAIDVIHDRTGNGNYNIHDKTESPYIFDTSKDGITKSVHDYVLKAKPIVHKQRMLKPVFRESEFCLTCHKVNLDVHVNDYRWLRGQNEYDNWYNSGWRHSNPTTWYEPPATKKCQDCHMPLEPTERGDVSAKKGHVKSHRFLAANTALPYIRGDKETIKRIEKFLEGTMRVDVFALHREDGTTIYPVNRQLPVLRPGEVVQVDVVVRNLKVGHTFPGGTNDSNEGWVDFQANIGARQIFRNGAILPNKQVDPSAHFFQAVIVDKKGGRIARRNAADIYTTVYANVIRPSTSDIARYRFRVPKDADGKEIKIVADLNWRKFNRTFTEFVFEGKEVPDLPVTRIAGDSVTLKVSSKPAKADTVVSVADDWQRYNDYGIGLYFDDDFSGALRMFGKVAEIKPKQFDGWLNQARAHLEEGSLDKADALLRKASAAAPDQPRIAFFWGLLLEKSGRFDDAVNAYRRVLQEYPDSRDTWARLGRVYWLMERPQDTINAFLEVLRIDPEDARAFHHLNLGYKALAAREKDIKRRNVYLHAANEAEKGFSKYKTDENAAKVTHQYRQIHPHDNRMSQKVVVHGQDIGEI